jgi:tetratricopeptide (TPR) repeat protein
MFQGCIEIDSSQPDLYYKKAIALEHLQFWDEALAAYQICIDNKYMLAESYYARGNIY